MKMGHSISIYGSNADTQRLTDYARAIGLHLIPPRTNLTVADDPADGPYCYLSLHKLADLEPYGDPAIRLGSAVHPVLVFRRPFYEDSSLILGSVRCSDDVPELYQQTHPYYQKLARWIRKEWRRYGDFYLGPEGATLFEGGASMRNVRPGSTFRYTIIET